MMRDTNDIAADLMRVRERRQQMFPTQPEPLSAASPVPAGFEPDAPGGEITQLLATEARLVLELNAARPDAPTDTASFPSIDEIKAALRVLQNIEQRSVANHQ